MTYSTHQFKYNRQQGERKEVKELAFSILQDYFNVKSKNIIEVKYDRSKRDRQLQECGVDIMLKDKNGKWWNIDMKNRDTLPKGYQYNDIGWEVRDTVDSKGSNIIRNGWGTKEDSLTDIILWIYWPIKKAILIDFHRTKDYYQSIEHGLDNEDFLKSNTKDKSGSILYYTWSYYIKLKDIQDCILSTYKVVKRKLRKVKTTYYE